ncbi:F-box/LRR-repeat protein At4g14103-like [Lotus japonicus]|uniref:F-box/LRR-repeat protein At4g14103-like n=1 Tax=Lotus japonicus TaxID=34305 RepID=UPI00258FFCAF|nr:F-box/LRR-repeat protein At4g14103-like [Lotus japonicus]XP_057425351.1 F-box/LRR-repeat protein At4g14103-like [Lotus japonicus]XP_057425359.1 F-box/LRR-repeat protein At4g14103-like [Lotus japonicus]
MDEMLIPPNAKRGRESESESENEENKDRLSDLPDCVLLHILSFVNAKYAVQTCTLSTRWKDLWKRLPSLILHSSDFSTFKGFTKFVSTILTLRDGSIALHGLDLKRLGRIQPCLFKRIIKYVISHNVQQLGLCVNCDIEHFPTDVFSCETLTYLKLSVHFREVKTLLLQSFNLPALTTLHLEHFTICANGNDLAEPFSTFIRLNSLIIHDCSIIGSHILCISSTTLCNLTVHNDPVDVYKIELSSPCLRTFTFTGTVCETLSGRNLSSIEHVNLDILRASKPDAVLNWLEELTNIKSLTISISTLKVLSLTHVLKLKVPPILSSLKSVKVKLRGEKSVLDVDFFLQNSPSAKIDFIRCSG